MRALWSPKALFTYGLALVAGAMGYAIYQQFFHGLEPCALCIFQRLAYSAYALIAIIALIQHPKGWGVRVYSLLQLFPAIIGLILALRQVWIQSLPLGQIPACGPGLNFLLQEYSVLRVTKIVWAGSSDCALVTWRFLGVSMAGWSAALFGVLILLSLIILFKQHHQPKTFNQSA